MSFLSKIFGNSKPQDETPQIPDDATARDVIFIAVDSVIEQSGGNCATLALAADRNRWVQIMDATINCHYPHEESPDWRFPELCNDPLIAALEGYEPATYMTVSLNAMTSPEI
jgi:hypothetical protein